MPHSFQGRALDRSSRAPSRFQTCSREHLTRASCGSQQGPQRFQTGRTLVYGTGGRQALTDSTHIRESSKQIQSCSRCVLQSPARLHSRTQVSHINTPTCYLSLCVQQPSPWQSNPGDVCHGQQLSGILHRFCRLLFEPNIHYS